MPTSANSNNPHVRIDAATHEKLRWLSFLRGQPQGEVVDQLVSAELEVLGNPQLQLSPLPPRQRRRPGGE